MRIIECCVSRLRITIPRFQAILLQVQAILPQNDRIVLARLNLLARMIERLPNSTSLLLLPLLSRSLPSLDLLLHQPLLPRDHRRSLHNPYPTFPHRLPNALHTIPRVFVLVLATRSVRTEVHFDSLQRRLLGHGRLRERHQPLFFPRAERVPELVMPTGRENPREFPQLGTQDGLCVRLGANEPLRHFPA